MSKEHDRLLDQLDETLAMGKKNAAEFGNGKAPAATYVGQLSKLEFTPSANGRPQIVREIVINEGDYKGEVCRDYQGIDNEIGMAILTGYIELHPGHEMPDRARLIPQVLAEILEKRPVYKFRWAEKNGYWSIRVQSLIEYAESDSEPVEPKQESEPVEPVESGNDEEEADRIRLLAFATDQGLEVTDDMAFSDIRESVGSYVYPLEGVTPAQLKEEQGWEDTDIAAATFITQDDADFLESIDLGDSVVKPDPKYVEVKKKTPPARKGKK